MIVSVITTSANESDMKYLEDVILKSELPVEAWIMADKGYKSKKNDEMLFKHNWGEIVMNKVYSNNSLTDEQSLFNKQISKIGYKVERTFGSM